jgi:hypothetical protein
MLNTFQCSHILWHPYPNNYVDESAFIGRTLCYVVDWMVALLVVLPRYVALRIVMGMGFTRSTRIT